MSSFTPSNSLSPSSLFVFLIAAVFLAAGCDSGGSDMDSGQAFTVEDLAGNWQLTSEYRSSDAFDPALDQMWWRFIPSDQIGDRFPEADSLEDNFGLAMVHSMEGDCELGPNGAPLVEIREDGFVLRSGEGDTFVPATLDGSTLVIEPEVEPSFRYERIETDIFVQANESHPVQGLSCNFTEIDTPFPRPSS